jgi:outer membrane protein assembly factor BamB
MHIVVYCPRCRSRYQLDPSLRGQRMRCPNSSCREVFEVWDEAPTGGNGPAVEALPEVVPVDEIPEPVAARRSPGRKPSSAHVSDVVPILEAEVVEEVPPADEAPPPRTVGGVPILTAEIVPPPASAPPADVPSWHEPPPVRTGAGASQAPSQLPVVAETPPLPAVEETAPYYEDEFEGTHRRKRGRRLIAIGAMLAVAGLLIGIVTVRILRGIRHQESDSQEAARKLYDEGKYASAAREFEKLAASFPTSQQVPQYQFMSELSSLRDAITSASGKDPRELLKELDEFTASRKKDPALKEHQRDIADCYFKLAEQLTERAEKAHDIAILDLARDALGKFQLHASAGSPEELALTDRIAKAEESINTWHRREKLLTELRRRLNDKLTADIVKDSYALARRERFQDDPEVKSVLTLMESKLRGVLVWVPAPAEPLKNTSEPPEPSLAVVPLVDGKPEKQPPSQDVFSGLVRGVLYALDQATGRPRWLIRVGIDTTTLPIRLRRTTKSPELFLVFSADRNTLMALVAQTGERFWQHKLSATCLGTPTVVVDSGKEDEVPFVYVATYDGKVHEIETGTGFSRGYFEIGQPLTVGGVWDEAADYLYLPGDSENLYVLDLARHAAPGQNRHKGCEKILRTGHASGSLRSEPIIVDRIDPLAHDANEQSQSSPYLVLSQTDGVGQMKLRVFGLPITQLDAPPLWESSQPIRGWSWFKPFHDGEKLAFVTDVGVFGLYGINQVRNNDTPLFPAFAQEPVLTGGNSKSLGRGQVVYTVENDYWVVAGGNMQRLQYDFFNQKLTPRWKKGIAVGSPVHASQIDASGKTLFVVTQDLQRQMFLATAVDRENGEIRWQRELGFECRGEPVQLGSELLLADRGGALFRFDLGKPLPKLPGDWALSESILQKAPETGVRNAYLLRASDGQSAYQILYPEQGNRLIVRIYQAGKGEIEEKHLDWTLNGPLAGPPALAAGYLYFPLAKGTIQRFTLPLDENGTGEGGPTWRAPRADDNATCFVVLLSPDEFLATDGSRGIGHWQWPAGPLYRAIPDTDRQPSVDARIVAAPLVLPRANPSEELQVFVADAGNTVTLLTGADLKQVRKWPLGGKLTGGPFVRGSHVGCIVNRTKLVWLDPQRDKPEWTYRMPGEGIVGQPQLVNGLLLVADLSGQFVGLDPAKGRPAGALPALKATAAPLATPLAFTDEETFVPLTDGTVYRLPLSVLGKPHP